MMQVEALIRQDRSGMRLALAYELIMSWPRIDAPGDTDDSTAEPVESAAVETQVEMLRDESIRS